MRSRPLRYNRLVFMLLVEDEIVDNQRRLYDTGDWAGV